MLDLSTRRLADGLGAGAFGGGALQRGQGPDLLFWAQTVLAQYGRFKKEVEGSKSQRSFDTGGWEMIGLYWDSMVFYFYWAQYFTSEEVRPDWMRHSRALSNH